MLLSTAQRFPRKGLSGIRCFAGTVAAISRSRTQAISQPISAEQQKRIATSDHDYQGAKWILSMAQKHAPDFEFRTLPKYSAIHFVMRRRSIGETQHSQAPPNAVWVPFLLHCCSGPRSTNGSFPFRNKPWPLESSAPAVFAVCFPLQLAWLIPAPKKPPRTITRGGMYEDCVFEGEASFSALSDKLELVWNHPHLRRATWADWLVQSNPSRTWEKSTALLTQLVMISPFDAMHFTFERYATFNATLMGRRILLRIAPPRRNTGALSIVLHRQASGVKKICYDLSADFEFLVVLTPRSRAEHLLLGRIGIFSKQQLYEAGFIADANREGGRFWMNFSWDGDVYREYQPIGWGDFFKTFDSPPGELYNFVVDRLSS